MSFSELGLHEPLLRALAAEGYDHPTPIQTQAIPPILSGRDLVGCAQTGTGKTAAFALPTLQRLSSARASASPRERRPIRCLVLTPTRELAAQIGDSFATYGRHLPLAHTVVFGGVKQTRQVEALRRTPDILVATPGRLLDLLSQRLVSLDRIEILVLDEADRMLDMGFLPDVRRILGHLPAERQTLLFSATMPADIQTLADRILRNPARVAAAPVATTADRIDETLYFVDRADKAELLRTLLDDASVSRALVFTRTKHGADRVARHLCRVGIEAAAIHGNKSQNARIRALDGFKRGDSPILVATDIAARGIDVDGVSHVVNFDLPNVPESYVHRIGRTARAGASGRAISLCAPEERASLRDIERLIRRRIPIVSGPARGSTERQPTPERTTLDERREHGNHVLQAPEGTPTRRQEARQGSPTGAAQGGESPARARGRRRGSRSRWYRSGTATTT
jgi:ATP-dependent RNA helicase RhlE